MAHSLMFLLKKLDLEDLALPSNIHYGKNIFARGGVEFVRTTDGEIEAWAGGLPGDAASGGGARRHVWLSIKDDKLNWHCSGNPKNHDIFCKHCVAVALKTLKNTSSGAL